MGVPDLATIFNLWSYERKIELLKCLLIGEAVKSSVQKTEDLPCFGANRTKCAETKTNCQLIRGQDICSKKLSARDSWLGMTY